MATIPFRGRFHSPTLCISHSLNFIATRSLTSPWNFLRSHNLFLTAVLVDTASTHAYYQLQYPNFDNFPVLFGLGRLVSSCSRLCECGYGSSTGRGKSMCPESRCCSVTGNHCRLVRVLRYSYLWAKNVSRVPIDERQIWREVYWMHGHGNLKGRRQLY